ncbi:Ets variant 7 [Cichlidogyrus casuarinus]|uniref:Ets variant 7 n=1 Tax=Cichlidogyrus casuarinus TaxID=1844966 RepID=A0ABD2Q6H4_9PLAT
MVNSQDESRKEMNLFVALQKKPIKMSKQYQNLSESFKNQICFVTPDLPTLPTPPAYGPDQFLLEPLEIIHHTRLPRTVSSDSSNLVMTDAMSPASFEDTDVDSLSGYERSISVGLESLEILSSNMRQDFCANFEESGDEDKDDYFVSLCTSDIKSRLKNKSQVKRTSLGYRSGRTKLLNFIFQLLSESNKARRSPVIWLNEKDRIFKIVSPSRLAAAWGRAKNNVNMTFQSLTRSLRLYYADNTLTHQNKNVYRFSEEFVKQALG